MTKAQSDHLKTSLSKFGFQEPIIVNQYPGRENTIVGGHMRVRVWKKMGNKTVPAVFVDLNEEAEREFNIRLNQNTGEWDWDVLANMFEKDDLKTWGFDGFDFGEQEEPEREKLSDASEKFELTIEFETEVDRSVSYDNLVTQGFKCRIK